MVMMVHVKSIPWSSGYGLSFRSNKKSQRPTFGTCMRGYGDSVGIVVEEGRDEFTEKDESREIGRGRTGEKIRSTLRHKVVCRIARTNHSVQCTVSGSILAASSLTHWQKVSPAYNNRGSCLRRGLIVMTGRPGKRRRAAVDSFRIPEVADGRKRQSAKHSIKCAGGCCHNQE
jgi:hypothetical protein